jgi:diacylglycerol kinase family enzyme
VRKREAGHARVSCLNWWNKGERAFVNCAVQRLRLPVIVSLTAGDAHPRRHEERLRTALAATADPTFSYPLSLPALRDAIVAEAESGATHIAVAGGDGTLHHAVNALGDRPVAIVPVPIGTGNDFSRALGVGTDLSTIATALGRLQTRRIDLIEVNARRVCTVAGAGIVADAGLQVGRLLAPGSSARPILRRFGRSAYLLGGAARLAFSWRVVKDAEIRWRDTKGTWFEWEGRLHGLFLANLPTLGAGLRLPFSSQMNDGAFELAVLPQSSRRRLIWSLGCLRSNRRLPAGTMIIERTREAQIRWKGGSRIIGDGEDLGHVEEIHARSLPGALAIGI